MRILAITQIPAAYTKEHEWEIFFSRNDAALFTHKLPLDGGGSLRVSPQLFALWCGKIINNYEWIEEKRVEKILHSRISLVKGLCVNSGATLHDLIYEFDSMTSS